MTGEFGRWAMQEVCVHCLLEQDRAVVAWVSAGITPCVWCRRRSAPLTPADYCTAIARGAMVRLDDYARTHPRDPVTGRRPW